MSCRHAKETKECDLLETTDTGLMLASDLKESCTENQKRPYRMRVRNFPGQDMIRQSQNKNKAPEEIMTSKSLYQTTSGEYGENPPTTETKAHRRPKDNKFSQSFRGVMYRNCSLNISKDTF